MENWKNSGHRLRAVFVQVPKPLRVVRRALRKKSFEPGKILLRRTDRMIQGTHASDFDCWIESKESSGNNAWFELDDYFAGYIALLAPRRR